MADRIGASDLCNDVIDPVSEREAELGPPIFLFQEPGLAGELGLDRARGPVLEVAQLFHDTVLDIRHFNRKGGAVRLGGARGAFCAPQDTVSDGSELVHHDGAQWVARVHESWAVSLWQGEEVRSLAELRAAGRVVDMGEGICEVPLPRESRLHVEMGPVGFVVREVIPGRRLPAALMSRLDYPFLGVMSLIGFVAAMLGIVVATSPPPATHDVIEVPDRFVELMIAKPEPKPAPKTKVKKAGPKDPGEKAKGKEGKRGKRDGDRKQAKGEALEQRQRDMDVVADAGIMGLLDNSGDLSGVLGSSALNADISAGVGGLIGHKGGDQIGSGGFSSRGSLFGSGGTAEGSGGIGTFGKGGGCADCGADGGDLGVKSVGKVSTGGTPIYGAGLDKSLIDEVIKRHMNQIRYCYQRQLTRDPDLAGKVKVFFVIAPDGSVSKANIKSSSLDNESAESCIANRFMTFQFPKVKGGGIVMVSYPFLFAPG